MIFSRYWIRTFVKAFLRVTLRLYYRSIQVKGLERLPREGPVLLVANHPNSLVDPAILIHLIPRTVRFGARHALFSGPLRRVLEAFGAIPLYRLQDKPKAMRQNLVAIDAYGEQLRKGHVTAIFPEGLSQDDPQVVPIKTGAARIALRSESGCDFKMGLKIVPVGLQFEPRRQFRADAFVRFGKPFALDDLAALYQESPKQAVVELTKRIDSSLKELAFHLESVEQEPFVERVVDVYLQRIRLTGLAGVSRKGLRGELLYRVAACLNHYVSADPGAVAEIEEELKLYEEERAKAGARRRLLEEPPRLLPGPLAIVQASAEALLGAPLAVVGLLTSGIPYYVTRFVSNFIIARCKHPPALSITHILVGALAFGIAYGLQIALVWRYFSDTATIAFASLLLPAGLFTLAYFRRMRKNSVHLGGKLSSWVRMGTLAGAIAARDRLIERLDHMRDRYRVEVLGWEPVSHGNRTKWLRVVPWFVAAAVLLAGFLVIELRDRQPEGLSEATSLWHELRTSDPEILKARLERDARATVAAFEELEHLQDRMHTLRNEFLEEERDYFNQEDQDEIHRLLLTYLNLRTALLRTVWVYRGSHDEPVEGELESYAFLLAYSSAAVLFEKAAVLVETFREDRKAQQKLNDGDLAWEIPEGTYNLLLASLSNAEVVSELIEANRRFTGLSDSGFPASGSTWKRLADTAVGAQPVIDQAVARIGERKLELALREMTSRIVHPVDWSQALVSTWIGDFRLKERPRHRGLISPDQVNDLREVLQPGDILLERRNWFLSNAFLPGFWPHAALYLGAPGELENLGVTEDPWVASHWDEFVGDDEAGHPYAVIEAISEGVVFTSLEHSVGEADAVAVLRPRLSTDQKKEAIVRAFSHLGKPYDFQFDFFSTHQLVCSEVVYRAYDGMLEFPLSRILGRHTLPVNTFVDVYAASRDSEACPFELVQFLDMDEGEGRAVPATEAAFLDTRERSRFTFLQ